MARKTTKKKSSNSMSLLEKYQKIYSDLFYPNVVENISTEELKKAFFPDVKINIGRGRAAHYASDSATGTVSTIPEGEYNGPIPLGYREIPPQMLNMNGIVGKVLKHFGARNFFLGDQMNGWFLQNCFVYKACSIPGDDAVACGYKIVPRGTKSKSAIEALKMKFDSEEFNLDETMRKFECYKRAFGGALMVPCFEEQDIDMENPLVDYSQLKGKTFIGWTIIEPYYLCPEIESGSRELTDPTYKFYMNPTHWNIYGGSSGSSSRRIHRSWCFFRRNMFTANIYQPMYKYFGPSVPQMILERLYSAEVCANESAMLLRSKRAFVIEADVRKMAANPIYAEKFLKNCQGNTDNWGVRIVPRNSNARQMDTYLTECMSLTTAQYGILCAEVDIPSPKFMMAQLTGFANSGNYEIKLYSANVKKIHTRDLIPIVSMSAKIEAACQGRNEEYSAEFGEIDIPTVLEEANILYEQARAAKFLAESKAIENGDGNSKVNNHKSTLELKNRTKG